MRDSVSACARMACGWKCAGRELERTVRTMQFEGMQRNEVVLLLGIGVGISRGWDGHNRCNGFIRCDDAYDEEACDALAGASDGASPCNNPYG